MTGHDSDHFSGSFCGAMIFNRKLSASEIRGQMHYLTPLTPAWGAWALQTSADLADMSGNGRNMTATGIPFVDDPKGPRVSLAPRSEGPCASLPNGTSCDDGNACTTSDVCMNGICLGITFTCDDGNACTDDSCNPTTGCTHSNRSGSCDDGNECTDDSCDPVAGCQYANNSAACDDHDSCTENDACDSGVCSGSLIPDCVECSVDGDCDDQNECTTDQCQSGICVRSANSNPCDDGNACTTDDSRVD